MSRRFVNELSDAEEVDEVFRASSKQLRPNRNGHLYLQVQLSDRSGSVTAMMWNANDRIYRSFQNGDYVQIEGNAQLYNGSIQIIATQLERVDKTTVDNTEFVAAGSHDAEKLQARLKEILMAMKNIHLRSLAECFLMDDDFMEQFVRVPAGIKIHHAYEGGLLVHVLSLMELALMIGQHYPEIDTDLLTIGAFLHDVGKTRELSCEPELAYTDEGQLVGHLVIGTQLFEQKVHEAEELSGEEFPSELALRIKHMIVSHHGEYQYGSSKLPMTLEAIALHYLDSLDSKIQSLEQLFQEDYNTDSNWTIYHSHLNRKLFKGSQT